MIGQFSGINLTQLANKLAISKSAISKCTSKLLEKELIGKEKSPVNVREVVFTLTPNGQTIFNQLETVQYENGLNLLTKPWMASLPMKSMTSTGSS